MGDLNRIQNSSPVQITDDNANVATVTNTVAGTETGLVVRNIPSGTQTVGGTVTLSSQTVTLGATSVTQPVSGTLTATVANSPTVTIGASSITQAVLDQADGPVTPGAAAAKSTLGGMVYNILPSAPTNAQQLAIQSDNAGNLQVTSNIATFTGTITGTGTIWTTNAFQTPKLYNAQQAIVEFYNKGTGQTILNGATITATTSVTNQSVVYTNYEGGTILNNQGGSDTFYFIQNYGYNHDSFKIGVTFAATTSAGSVPFKISFLPQAMDVTSGSLNSLTPANIVRTIGQGDGTVTAGTAGAKSVLAGIVYNTVAPAPTNGQQMAMQSDASGNLKVNISAGTVTVAPLLSTAPAGTESGLVVRNIPSGTQTVAGTVTAIPSGTYTVASSGGTFGVTSTANTSSQSQTWTSGSTNSLALSGPAGVVYSVHGTYSTGNGVFVFEASDDNGTTFYPASFVRVADGTLENTVTLTDNLSRAWVAVGTGGALTYRMRQTSGTVSSGTLLANATSITSFYNYYPVAGGGSSGGTVTIGATSVTQPVSGTVTATVANNPTVTIGATSVTQPVSGTVSVSNPSAQLLSTAPGGTEIAVVVRNIPSGTQSMGGTSVTATGSITSATSTATAPVTLTLSPGQGAALVTVSGTYTVSAGGPVIAFQGSDDGANFYSIEAVISDNSASLSTDTLSDNSTNRAYFLSGQGGAWKNLRVLYNSGGVTSGTVTINMTAATGVSTKSILVQGDVASGTVNSGSPVQIGGRTTSAIGGPTVVADNQRVGAMFDRQGRLVVTAADRAANVVMGTASLTTTAAANLITNQGSGIFCDIASIFIANTASSAVTVSLFESGGKTYRFAVAAASSFGLNFIPPIRATTANTTWQTSIAAAATTVYVHATGVNTL